jgi:flagellar biosynthetic protein FliR
MPDVLAELLAPARWPAFVCLSARLVGLMLVAPLWSMPMLPRSVRSAIVVLLAMLLLPAAPAATLPDATALVPLPLLAELLIGLAIGLCAAVLMAGISLAGEVATQQMGLNMGAVLSPMGEQETAGVAQLQSYLGMVVYLAVGGHLVLLRGLGESLQAIPLGAGASFARADALVGSLGAAVFETGVRVGAPIIAALLVANVALALLNRAVPQLNALMVSFPITIALGLVAAGLALPAVAGVTAKWMGTLDDRVTGAVELLAPRS